MVWAKKSYGQHFLKDSEICYRIAGSMQSGLHNVLEVGPGTGMLTRCLMEIPGINLKCVEADRDMVTYLEKNLPALKDNIISADFLDIDLRTVFGGEPFILIGNFPYNISSQILIKAMETSELIPEVVGMFQKEVGERVCAKPSTSDYNGLTVQMQAFYTTEYLFSLPPEAFNPPPKVFSGVIRLVRLDREWDCDPVKFRKIVRQAFAQRRKMLRNTLAGLLPKETLFADDFFTRRAETLTVEDFIKLTNRIDGK